MHRVLSIPVLALASSMLALACSRDPGDVREWRPTDHDHTQTPNAAQVEVRDGGPSGFMGVDEVGLAAWRAQCVKCHGIVGRGDGPQGPMVKARNLSDPAWQASVSDEQIATSIRQGKGEMPAAELPEATITSLVRLVRLLSAAGPPSGPDAGPGDAGSEDAGRAARPGATSAKPAGAKAAAPQPAPSSAPAAPAPAKAP